MNISYSKQALKFLEKQNLTTRQRIVNAINLIPAGDIKKLQGVDGYRLRVGDFRIIFNRIANAIYVERIESRGQVYKGA